MNPASLPEHDARHIDYPAGYASGTVVLVSGGTDSLINADAHPDATLLFVDFGHADAVCELAACRDLFEHRALRVAHVHGGIRGTGGGLFVPARNLLLACLAVHHGDDIVIGAMRDDHSLDKTEEAFAAMQRILTAQAGRPVAVRAPLLSAWRHEAVAAFVRRDAARGRRMLRTWSCYGSGPERCMDCKACLRWFAAMRWAGLDTPKPSGRMVQWALSRLDVLEEPERAVLLSVLGRERA